MPYFANFQVLQRCQFRFDTRVYLRESDQPSRKDTCVAAVIGKNPGSANPSVLNHLKPISLDGDKLLPYVRNRFLNAYKLAGIQIPPGTYVRVWNIVYICNKNLAKAIKAFAAINNPTFCKTERRVPSIVWFAWGPPHHYLGAYTRRFTSLKFQNCFYFDITERRIVIGTPGPLSKVKHTQGLPAKPVEEHLSTLLKRVS